MGLAIILGVVFMLGGLAIGIVTSVTNNEGVLLALFFFLGMTLTSTSILIIEGCSSTNLPSAVTYEETHQIVKLPNSDEYIIENVNSNNELQYTILYLTDENTIKNKTFNADKVSIHYVKEDTTPYYQYREYEYANKAHKFCLFNNFSDTIDIYIPFEYAEKLLP